MIYKVIADVDVKTPTSIKSLKPGQVIKLSTASAAALIAAGKIEPIFEPVNNPGERMAIVGENCAPEEIRPYVTDFGALVIPWNSNARYHYWKKGGQSLCETLKELGRCDLIPKYRSIYN